MNWPSLPLQDWEATRATLHMWTQIVGKIRMTLTPHINHWWEVPLYVSPQGLTTSAIPYANGAFEIEFDFLEHNLAIRSSDRALKYVPLYARSVADFYRELMAALGSIGITVSVWTTPVEIADPIPFPDDHKHASYDPEYVGRFHQILLNVGKVSPVHFFWGSFDLAVTRFSGRRAPQREGADAVTREAYSHECSSAGFWCGGGDIAGPAFYSYAAPTPPGFAECTVLPPTAFFHAKLGEFLVMYDDVRHATAPKEALMNFLQSTYEAAANSAKWDRAALER
jgi:hypothetical protein